MSQRPSPLLVVVAGWLVPGAGHFVLGRRTQAIVFFLVITITFVGGMFLTDFTNVSFERHKYYFAAHVMNGAEAVVASLLTRDRALTEVPRHLGQDTEAIGILYTAVAALLNVMIVMNAWSISLGLDREEAADVAAEEAT